MPLLTVMQSTGQRSPYKPGLHMWTKLFHSLYEVENAILKFHKEDGITYDKLVYTFYGEGNKIVPDMHSAIQITCAIGELDILLVITILVDTVEPEVKAVPNMMEDIKNFHEKFHRDYNDTARFLPEDLNDFRIKFLAEELNEYVLAETKAHKLDALVDLVYVALGTAYLHGFDFNEGWRRVHEQNMKKVAAKTAEESKRGSAYDIVKPEGWVPADLSDIVGE